MGVVERLKAADRRVQAWSPGAQDLLVAEALPKGATLIDVGCGRLHRQQRSYLDRVSYSVGVDLLPAGDVSTGHDSYREVDARAVLDVFGPRSFDAALSVDVIEHLPKDDGWKLLDTLEAVARQRVIVATPNGFLPQCEYDGNVYQEHLSGWEPWEFRDRGYRVFGANGWQRLRGGRDRNNVANRYIGRLNAVTRWTVVNRPEHAYQFVAVADIK